MANNKRKRRFRVVAQGGGIDKQPWGWALQVSSYTGWKTVRVWAQDKDDPDYTWLYDEGEKAPRHEYSYAHLCAEEAKEMLEA